MSTPSSSSTHEELSGSLPAVARVATRVPWFRRQIDGARRTAVAVWRGFLDAWSDHMTKIGVVLLSLFVLAAIVGPEIVDTPPFETNRLENGAVARNLAPSWDYPAGTRTVDTRIAELRRALGDSPTDPQYIETVTGQGYRFVGFVEAAS